MLRRGSRRKTANEEMGYSGAGSDQQSLLVDVEHALAQIRETLEHHQREQANLEEQLGQLDGVAQRLALSGLVAEGTNVLNRQRDLAEYLQAIQSAIIPLQSTEQRLADAQAELSNQTDAPSVLPPPAEDDTEPSHATVHATVLHQEINV